MSYVSLWMSAKEALEYVGKISACDQAMAFDQIRCAVRDEDLRFLTPQETALRNVGCSLESLMAQEERKIETAIESQRATFLLADTSQFEKINSWFSEGFEFCREDVLRIWQKPNRRSTAKPITSSINEAIDALYPNGIPPWLRRMELNSQIKEWLARHGKPRPNSDPAVARAVQRAIKARRNR